MEYNPLVVYILVRDAWPCLGPASMVPLRLGLGIAVHGRTDHPPSESIGRVPQLPACSQSMHVHSSHGLAWVGIGHLAWSQCCCVRGGVNDPDYPWDASGRLDNHAVHDFPDQFGIHGVRPYRG